MYRCIDESCHPPVPSAVYIAASCCAQVFEFCMKKTKVEALKLIEKIGIKLTSEDKELSEKQLLKVTTAAPPPHRPRPAASHPTSPRVRRVQWRCRGIGGAVGLVNMCAYSVCVWVCAYAWCGCVCVSFWFYINRYASCLSIT